MRLSFSHAILSLAILGNLASATAAQQTPTPQNGQGPLTPPGGPQDAGGPVVIGETGASATGAITTFTVLNRNPSDLEHATDPQTGRNFNWDSATNTWVNSQSGQSFHSAGYLCSTSGPSSAATPTTSGTAASTTDSNNAGHPQTPGSPQDAGGPLVIGETGTSATGAITTFTVLNRNPSDLEHATDPQTGRNFNWDSATNTWVNSQSGQSFHSAGYLCSTPGRPAPATTAGAQPSDATPQQNTTPPIPNKPVSMSGFAPMFQLRGFGGASFINGNTPGTSGFDGAVLFPLGNRILVGPTAGFQWVGSSVVSSIGAKTPGSTFINTSVGFKQGNFGGQIDFPFKPIDIVIHGGATVAGSAITQAEGFCGLGNATSPAGCTVFNTTTTHDTVVGSFVGGYISHSIFPHVGIFAGYDYLRLKDTTSAGTASGSSGGGKQTLFDTHNNVIVGGFMFTFGARHER